MDSTQLSSQKRGKKATIIELRLQIHQNIENAVVLEETLQITKAPFTKIWHIFKAKAIAALEKYVIVLSFGIGYLIK